MAGLLDMVKKLLPIGGWTDEEAPAPSNDAIASESATITNLRDIKTHTITPSSSATPAATGAVGAPPASGTMRGNKDDTARDTRTMETYMNILQVPATARTLTDAESPQLKKYAIDVELNHGAFSKVYRATIRSTGAAVAIKKMPKAKLSRKQRENILREAAIHKRLHHPNIVQFVDFFETAEHYYLVMELMRGGELFGRIEQVEYFTEEDARVIITQVAKAIKFLHDNGVVHRDIKPENLVFSNNTLTPIKLCDFGLSKTLDMGSTDTPCGTVGYIAPEVAKEQHYTFSVDIWALGCVLYSMLCGFPAFYDSSINVLSEKVKRGVYDFPSPWWDEVSSLAKDLIRHCLCVDPSKRYTVNQFLNHPWISTRGPTLPLTSPAILKEMDATVMPMDYVFDITYAAHLEHHDKIAPSRHSIVTPHTLTLNDNLSASTLLVKRNEKLKLKGKGKEKDVV